MKNHMKRNFLLAALLLAVFVPTVRAEGPKHPAFPGAEGFGKYAKGGRGGEVYHVTNLRDDGPGSLRYGIDTTNGPRTIVFDVAGTLQLVKPVRIENKSCLTIAGQTAPGKRITIRDHALAITRCSDIVVRYLRLRLGDKNKGDSSGEDVMTVDYRNCVNFNWQGPTNFGGMKLTVVNNYYKPGPCSTPDAPPMQMKDGDWFVNGYSKGKSNRYVIFRRRDGAYVRTTGFYRGDYEGDIRIDPAPCWNRDSNAILVPGIAGGSRQLFVIRVKER